MVQAIGSKDVNSQVAGTKPVNIVQRAKTKAVAFRDAFAKSDENTKAKINTGLSILSAFATLVTFAGAKNFVARCLGAVTAFASSVSLAVLNMPSNLLSKNENVKK